MTLDTILLARALRDPATAAYLVRTLDVHRTPADVADAKAVRFWRCVLPLLAVTKSDPVGLSEAIATAGYPDACTIALAIPPYLDAAAGSTRDLVSLFNAGGGTQFRLSITAGARPVSTSIASGTRKVAA